MLTQRINNNIAADYKIREKERERERRKE